MCFGATNSLLAGRRRRAPDETLFLRVFSYRSRFVTCAIAALPTVPSPTSGSSHFFPLLKRARVANRSGDTSGLHLQCSVPAMYPAYLRGVPPTPASVPRTPLPAATSGAKAYGPGLVAAEVGCAATFTVETLDPYDERRRSGGDVVVARLMVGSEVTVEAFSADNQEALSVPTCRRALTTGRSCM